MKLSGFSNYSTVNKFIAGLIMEIVLIAAALLLLFSIIGSLASDKMGIPSLILFLLIGILAGPGGIGKIKILTPLIAQQIGVISLAFIIFSAGLGTSFQTIKPVLSRGLILS